MFLAGPALDSGTSRHTVVPELTMILWERPTFNGRYAIPGLVFSGGHRIMTPQRNVAFKTNRPVACKRHYRRKGVPVGHESWSRRARSMLPIAILTILALQVPFGATSFASLDAPSVS